MKRITIKRVLASNSTLICNQTVKNVGRNSRAMNIRNQVLLAINVRQWSSFKSLFFPIFSVLNDNKCAMYVYIVLHIRYTANVLTIKTTGTGNCGVPAGKICTIYGKGL